MSLVWQVNLEFELKLENIHTYFIETRTMHTFNIEKKNANNCKITWLIHYFIWDSMKKQFQFTTKTWNGL